MLLQMVLTPIKITHFEHSIGGDACNGYVFCGGDACYGYVFCGGDA